MDELLGDDAKLHRSDLARAYSTARPFRHVIVENFFTESFCARLLEEFPAFDRTRALDEFGEVGNKSTCEDVRSLGPAYRAMDDLFQSVEFRELITEITGVQSLVYDPLYFGGGTHENRPGQDLDPHVDFNYHPVTALHRRLNLIVYLNREWEETWGGSIELHSDPWSTDDASVSFAPLFNRAILFETNEHSWHGFKRISPPPSRRDISRRSITIYYYSKSRPTEETAPPHTTFYVPRGIPARFGAGYCMTPEDADDLHELVARRDRFIRFYQSRELEFGEQIESMRERMKGAQDVPEAWIGLGRRLFASPVGERYLARPLRQLRRRMRT